MSAPQSLHFAILGLSITSSWGNGHATTYRGLVRELVARGHRVTFLERDVPWYASNRDLAEPPWCETVLYADRRALVTTHAHVVRDADVVIVGSFVPEGVAVGEWAMRTAQGLVAFYDLDTPVTLAKLEQGDHEYLEPSQIGRYGLYLSFTAGPTLGRLEHAYGSPAARPLHCAVDPTIHYPEPTPARWDLGYMGTYSADRQPTVDRLLVETARSWSDGRFAVVGPMYPDDLAWPPNVERRAHLAPSDHRAFYNAQRFTLNVTRVDMLAAGWSPSVRLFEAAACATPIVGDAWPGIDDFFEVGTEILVARDARDMHRVLCGMPDDERRAIGEAARARVLAAHTAGHRAQQLERYVTERLGGHLA